jgi:hypothetical protein
MGDVVDFDDLTLDFPAPGLGYGRMGNTVVQRL